MTTQPGREVTRLPLLSPGPVAETPSVRAGASLEQMCERSLARAAEHEQAAQRLLAEAQEHEAKARVYRAQAGRESAGLEGERVVGAVLDSVAAAGWRILHDRRVRGSTANIDHIAVGPGGIVVVDAKAYSGSATIAGDELRVGGWRRVDEVDAVSRYARTVAATVGSALPELGAVTATPVMCFARPVGLPAPVSLRGVMLAEHETLAAWLCSLPPFLGQKTVAQIAQVIDAGHRPRTEPAPSTNSRPTRPTPQRRLAVPNPRVGPVGPARTGPRARPAPGARSRTRSALARVLLALALALVGVCLLTYGVPAMVRSLQPQVVKPTPRPAPLHPPAARTGPLHTR